MLYAGAYGNIGGYVIGLITGYCFYKSRGKKLFRSKVCSLIFSLDQELWSLHVSVVRSVLVDFYLGQHPFRLLQRQVHLRRRFHLHSTGGSRLRGTVEKPFRHRYRLRDIRRQSRNRLYVPALKKISEQFDECDILGFIRDVMTWAPLMPLGRITYCTYLVHVAYIRAWAGQIRAPQHTSDFILVSTKQFWTIYIFVF